MINDGKNDIKILANKQADAKALATKVASDIKTLFSNIATKDAKGNLDIKNVAENASKIYATLNTDLANDLLATNVAAGKDQPTVFDLINTIYKDATGTGATKADADANLKALQALQPKIVKVIDDFVAKADALNKTFSNARVDLSFISNVALLPTANSAVFTPEHQKEYAKEYAEYTKQLAIANDKIKVLAAANVAKLNAGANLATEKGTEITNASINGLANKGITINATNYGAVTLQSLLADNTITDAEIKAYNELIAALNEMKKQLNRVAVGSSFADVAKNSKSNVVKSLNEAGLKNLVMNNLNLVTTDARDQVTDITIAQDIAEQIEKPIREASNSLSNVIGGGFNAPAAALSMANQTNTMTRLAKLSTPYSKDLALANAIKNMDGLEVASGDNSALSSIIKEYTDRFNYDNSVYANVIGAKGYTDNGDPKLYGFSVGYDRSFDNFLVGSYFTYAKSDLDTSYLESEADNFELGIYSRAYLGDSEVDTTLSFGIGKNDINNYKLLNEYLNGDYDSKFINLAATYGYVVKAQNSLFIKPFIGLNYAYNKNDSFTLSNNAGTIQDFEKIDGSTLSANLGVELRKYLSDGSFMFITPSVEQELSVSRDDLVSKFRGASTSFTTQADETKDTYAKVIAGGEYAVTKDFSATVSAGFKTNGDDRYVNGSLGLKYKF
ncbi:autotransporter outer membrane beta-barrel domain-containing protein [Campylobacter hyointestinalis]|uniref:autotransporter outer membrane beta-barrel domain-containing protein n=1 Tax=Campylobacter hyointestinalis TaxID=198 RepID=UPI000DCC14E9|nr:autotransporter outer membrane beta-barrel domain-containing protein [Campylobacter hyointestinalis]RAZ53747.1 hypothetical protein CHL10074_08670 [Campylobacter hyointestinalis subsp. lawsonii]RAZ62650.1 hypothetical protein CHL9767_08380 [Campylobacter hyointestinalis subsp. lawsonii]